MTSICMISDDFNPVATGVGIHLQLVAPELVRRGCRVCIATVAHPDLRAAMAGRLLEVCHNPTRAQLARVPTAA